MPRVRENLICNGLELKADILWLYSLLEVVPTFVCGLFHNAIVVGEISCENEVDFMLVIKFLWKIEKISPHSVYKFIKQTT